MAKRYFLLLSILFCTHLNAQISFGGFPYPEVIKSTQSVRTARSLETIILPAIDSSAIASQDEAIRMGGTQFAFSHKVCFTPENSGVLLTDSLGTKVWRLRVRSEGAYSLNVIFNRYRLEKGEKVFIYTPSKSHIIGAFTEKNNLPEQLLATAPVEGDEIIIEYISPKGCNGELSVGSINHDFVGLRKLPSFDNSLYCQIDVTCENRYSEEKRSGVLIIINGTTYCSGNLINNTAYDGTPYLLTASHCLNFNSLSKSEALAATCVFFFNYQTPHCFPGIRGNMEMSISGAEIMAFDGERDLTLLQLSSQPPVDYMPYYAGWDASDTPAENVFCIHHPEGDLKKIAYDSDSPKKGTFLCSGMFAAEGHWIVDFWEEGLTENGSSGSALFNQDKRIIGALSGGYSDVSCEERGFDAFYRLGIVWEDNYKREGLKTFLDPTESGALTCDGFDPYRRGCSRIGNFRTYDELYYTTSEEEFLTGHNNLNIRHFAERFYLPQGGEVYGIHFIPETGSFNSKYPIYVHLYSGDEKPENLLHSQLVKLQNQQYVGRTNEIQNKILESLTKRDNYLRFDQPIVVDSTFFIVFELPENYSDKFSLYHTKIKTSGNSSYFMQGNKWLSFENHPVSPGAISMMIEPVVRRPEKTDIQDVFANPISFDVIPNPSDGEVKILINTTEEVKIELYDIAGRAIYNAAEDKQEHTLPSSLFREKGLYLLKIISSETIQTQKIIRK